MSPRKSSSLPESEFCNSLKNSPPSPLAAFRLHRYQMEILGAVLDSAIYHKGLTFSVEIARQGGKNEISAQLEVSLLMLNMTEKKNLIKCAPTFIPQAVISMTRLTNRLNDAGYAGIWESELGYIVRLCDARAIFLSADKTANVVGNTAHLLLEIDEAQDVDKEKYTRDFKPMGSTTNVTTVLYGTTWDDSTLLEEVKQTNLEMERKDGIRRHFRCDWQEVAKYNPSYLAYVEGERERLGEDHPLFRTQYCLLPVHGGGGFFSSSQKAQLQGGHARIQRPESGKIYVAGIDLAGEAEEINDFKLWAAQKRRDSTVITIGELDSTVINKIQKQPGVKIVEHYRWTGTRHTELYSKIIDLVKGVWGCKKIVVDATGAGQPVASFLKEAVGSHVIPFVFTPPSKSLLGFNLQAAVNSGRLKMYAADNSEEYREFWFEIDNAQSQYRASQTLNFFVDPVKGHDDFLMSTALLVEAANQCVPREAKGSLGK
jgi:Terminase RNaseH-like domain